jgi:tetratricopeptide (TPR) repeat protein
MRKRTPSAAASDDGPNDWRGEPITTVKVFVAMPGSDFGKNATYDTPELVRDNLLIPVCERVAMLLRLEPRRVELKIERDKTKGGDIYQSMYREACEADVYIADLTGSNPNVYLELGVRWAFRESVTVPIVQDPADLRFNVSKARVQVYTPKTIQLAVRSIAQTIVTGLTEHAPDSPILSCTDLVWMTRREREQLETEIQAVRRSEVKSLLERARRAGSLAEKIAALQQASEKAPTSSDVALHLGVAYREASDYAASEKLLLRAVDLDPTDPVAHRELGVTLGKAGKYGAAIEYLRAALRMNGEDAETHSNLGGALRRAAESHPDGWSVRDLKESYACYQNALRLNRFDLYAALNVGRTGLILSRWDEAYREAARRIFRQQIHLASYVVSLEPDNAWRWLDLADCYLFTGELAVAEENVRSALDRVQADRRQDTIASYLRPLHVCLQLEVLDSATSEFVRKLISLVSNPSSRGKRKSTR